MLPFSNYLIEIVVLVSRIEHFIGRQAKNIYGIGDKLNLREMFKIEARTNYLLYYFSNIVHRDIYC